MADLHADADPDETVTMTDVGAMTLRRAVRKRVDWRDHHGLALVVVYRQAGRDPATFDAGDLERLAEVERFKRRALPTSTTFRPTALLCRDRRGLRHHQTAASMVSADRHGDLAPPVELR